MAYGKYKELTKRTESDKVLGDKAFKVSSNPKHDEYERGLASMIYKFFDKTFTGSIWGADLADMQSLRKYNKRI